MFPTAPCCGIETADEGDTKEATIEHAAYVVLLQHEEGTINVLVTHDAPYGVSVGYHGQVQGSRLITQLIERVQPAYHVAGHLALLGPHVYGATTSLVLEGVVASPLWDPGARGLSPGCLAVLDTGAARLWPVTEPWLARFPTPFDADAWLATLAAFHAP